MSKQINPLPVAVVYEYPWWADILTEIEEILQQLIEDQYVSESDYEQYTDQEYWYNGDE